MTFSDPASAHLQPSITAVTRYEIFDYLRGISRPWRGRLDEVTFLEGLYDLDQPASENGRRPTVRADIQQHRINNDFLPALEQFLNSSAGLSHATVTRLTPQWQADHTAFQDRDLSEHGYVYMWADGAHPKVRLGQAHSCVLVLMGVRLDGTKELIALAEGLRESTESWADLLRDCRRRGRRDPELVVGDGAMGLWRALAEVVPKARHQRCWVHKIRNVVNALPKSAQPGAVKAMQEIYNSEDCGHAEKAVKEFERVYVRSGPGRPPRLPSRSTNSWRSTTSPPSTGCTCARRIRSSRPSAQ